MSKTKVALACAIMCHQVNMAYCQSIGDDSQVEWDKAPEWQKESAVNGVLFRMDNPESMPEDSHKSWMAQKEQDGWKYGEVKDEQKKEHPCMVPYDELPEQQKAKDLLFITTVDAFLTAMNEVSFDDLKASADEVKEQGIMRFFKYAHLPAPLQSVSEPIGVIAKKMERHLPPGPEKAAGMRKLLEARDCFVRAKL